MTSSTKTANINETLVPGGSAYESMKHEVESLSRAIADAQITNEKSISNENVSRKASKSETDHNELSDHGGGDCNGGHIVVIDIEEKALKCDRRLLTQHSKYFEALFAFQEIPTNRVRLKGKTSKNQSEILSVESRCTSLNP